MSSNTFRRSDGKLDGLCLRNTGSWGVGFAVSLENVRIETVTYCLLLEFEDARRDCYQHSCCKLRLGAPIAAMSRIGKVQPVQHLQQIVLKSLAKSVPREPPLS